MRSGPGVRRGGSHGASLVFYPFLELVMSIATAATIDAIELKRCLRAVLFASDTESSRFALGGAYFANGQVTCTDGRRASRTKCSLVPDDDPFLADVILDRAGLKKLAGALTAKSGAVEYEITATSAVFRFSKLIKKEPTAIEITIERVQGRFPACDDYLPDAPEGTGTISGRAEDLVRWIDAATEGTVYHIEPDGTIRPRYEPRGRVSYDLQVEGAKVAMNPDLLRDWLVTLADDARVKIWTNEDKPCYGQAQGVTFCFMPCYA